MIHPILVGLSIILFVLAAVRLQSPVDLGWLGMAFLALSFIV